jgi:hypothetical protein
MKNFFKSCNRRKNKFANQNNNNNNNNNKFFFPLLFFFLRVFKILEKDEQRQIDNRKVQIAVRSSLDLICTVLFWAIHIHVLLHPCFVVLGNSHPCSVASMFCCFGQFISMFCCIGQFTSMFCCFGRTSAGIKSSSEQVRLISCCPARGTAVMLLGHSCQGEATDRQNLEGWKEGRKGFCWRNLFSIQNS